MNSLKILNSFVNPFQYQCRIDGRTVSGKLNLLQRISIVGKTLLTVGSMVAVSKMFSISAGIPLLLLASAVSFYYFSYRQRQGAIAIHTKSSSDISASSNNILENYNSMIKCSRDFLSQLKVTEDPNYKEKSINEITRLVNLRLNRDFEIAQEINSKIDSVIFSILKELVEKLIKNSNIEYDNFPNLDELYAKCNEEIQKFKDCVTYAKSLKFIEFALSISHCNNAIENIQYEYASRQLPHSKKKFDEIKEIVPFESFMIACKDEISNLKKALFDCASPFSRGQINDKIKEFIREVHTECASRQLYQSHLIFEEIKKIDQFESFRELCESVIKKLQEFIAYDPMNKYKIETGIKEMRSEYAKRQLVEVKKAFIALQDIDDLETYRAALALEIAKLEHFDDLDQKTASDIRWFVGYTKDWFDNKEQLRPIESQMKEARAFYETLLKTKIKMNSEDDYCKESEGLNAMRETYNKQISSLLQNSRGHSYLQAQIRSLFSSINIQLNALIGEYEGCRGMIILCGRGNPPQVQGLPPLSVG